MAMDVHLLPVLASNYAYLLEGPSGLVVIDPGEAGPVLDVLSFRGVHLDTILITHLHQDHIGGVGELRAAYPGVRVISPAPFPAAMDAEPVPADGRFLAAGHACQGLDTPGHATPHAAYYFPDAHTVFSGDALFGGGCGRLFGHPPEILFASLQRLAALPPSTRIYCGHEMTLDNLAFAATVDPENPAIRNRLAAVKALRDAGQPSLPSTLADELATNPFLRCDDPGVKAGAGLAPDASALEVFTALRRMKDNF